MSKNFKIILAIACLALAIMACNAVQNLSIPGSGSGGNSNGNVNTNTIDNTNTNINTNINTNANINANSNANTNSNNNTGGSNPSGAALLTDDFSDSNSGWGTGTDADSVVEYVNGGLQMVVIKTDYFVYSTPNDTAYQNVHLSATVANNSSDNLATFGIMCNQQVTKDAYYYLGISPNGEYAIAKAAVAKATRF